VERLYIMSPATEIKASDIPPPFNQAPDMKEPITFGLAASTYKEAKGIFEKAFLEKKLQEFDWNISQTAEAIGIERSNLHKKIKAYGLDDSRSQ
jgi:two-component system nitrogen regulation response regulator NtrX